jgi:hypothetical protein
MDILVQRSPGGLVHDVDTMEYLACERLQKNNKTLSESLDELIITVNYFCDKIINDLEHEILLKTKILYINNCGDIQCFKNLFSDNFFKQIKNIIDINNEIDDSYLFNIDLDDYFNQNYIFFPCIMKNNKKTNYSVIKQKIFFLLNNNYDYLELFGDIFSEIIFYQNLNINNLDDISRLFLKLYKIFNNKNNITILIFKILVNMSVINDINKYENILIEINKFIIILNNLINFGKNNKLLFLC